MALLVATALPIAAGCGGRGSMKTGTGGSGPIGTGGLPVVQTFAVIPTRNQLDLLFVVDDANAAAEQAKLVTQAAALVQVLESLPDGLPDLHLGIVTTDLGTAGHATAGCSAAGDAGAFRAGPGPGATCAQTPLQSGATYLAQNGDSRNFTGQLEAALSCLLPVGTTGCGFIQPLAAAARALGADGAPPPAANAGFLRPNAALGIVVLASQDDCSVPAGTQLFDLQTGQSSLAEPQGPLNSYRCNRSGHLCRDGDGNQTAPPLAPPPGSASATFTACTDSGTAGGQLIPVDQLVQQIRSLKRDPDHQISVSAIVGPPAPYTVAWQPAGDRNPQNPDELWPAVMHSCGPAGGAGVNPSATQLTGDGSTGDPAVRITQFVNQFPNHALVSICDSTYRGAMTAIAASFNTLPPPDCIDPLVPSDADGQPRCTVVRRQVAGGVEQRATIRNCGTDSGLSPSWIATADQPGCTAGARALQIRDDASGSDSFVSYDVSCPLCPGAAGCQ
jgi:hypothetical protein